jgi:hypothetical protein
VITSALPLFLSLEYSLSCVPLTVLIHMEEASDLPSYPGPFLFFMVGLYSYGFSSECYSSCTPLILACCMFVSIHFKVFSNFPSDLFFVHWLFSHVLFNFHVFVKFPSIFDF